MKKVLIVGGGPGGLTAGMLLASQQCEVSVYEQNHQVGGRNQRIEMGEYAFDLGPTFLMLPELLLDIFTFTGRDISKYLDLKEIDPLYRLRFSGGRDFLPTRNPEDMRKQIAALFPGDENGYDTYLKEEGEKFNRVFDCLKMPYHKLSHLLRPKFIHAIPKLDLGKTLYDKLKTYFSYDEMRIAMTFQSKYLGMSPWTCPAAFTILSYIEHSRGILHPIGGLNQISIAMAKVIEEEGGKIHLNTPVTQILIENNVAVGIELADGTKVMGDAVIINADFAHAMSHLVPSIYRKKYTDKALKAKDYSCSTFMLYLGLDKFYDIPHHNIIFADDYKKNVYEIAQSKTLSDDPSIYVQNASATDPTLAPEGKSTLYVLVPVPNNTSGIDWNTETASFKERILNLLMSRTELTDLKDHIEVEKIITPYEWEHTYNVYNGATFNLSHKLTQMLYFRPHNIFEEFDNCFLVGGGTHPGSGLPTIYESGRISANMILQGHRLGSAFKYRDFFDDFIKRGNEQ